MDSYRARFLVFVVCLQTAIATLTSEIPSESIQWNGCTQTEMSALTKKYERTAFGLEHGLEEHRNGRFDAARCVFASIVESDPDNSDAWHLLGIAHHMEDTSSVEQAMHAVRFINIAIDRNPRGANLYRQNALKILLDSNKYDEASTHLEFLLDGLEEDDDSNRGRRYKYLTQLLHALNELGRFEDALLSFNRWNRMSSLQDLLSRGDAMQVAKRLVADVGKTVSPTILGGQFEKVREWRTSGHDVVHVDDGATIPVLSAPEAETVHQLGLTLTYVDRFEDALAFFVAVLRSQPLVSHHWFNLGVTLSTLGEYDVSNAAKEVGVLLKHADDYDEASKEGIRLVPRPSDRVVVAIYCDEYGNSWWPAWGPSSTGTGIGGSEEAVIYISRELAKLGHIWVEVYAKPPSREIGETNGVAWYPHEWYSYVAQDAPDIFVSWRYGISVVLGTHATQTYLWLQDIGASIAEPLTPEFVRHIDGVFTLSNFHTSMLPAAAQSKAFVTPNAMDPHHFDLPESVVRSVTRRETRFIYASAPNRGLEQLLTIWPLIYDGLNGDAELWVYYGFTDAFQSWARSHMSDFDTWMLHMRRLLDQDGVRYVGMVNQSTLSEAYWRSGFSLYPTSFPETGCVALMKAQALGAVPITSRYEKSTLPELTGRWDLGPPSSPGEIRNDPDRLVAYAHAVVRAASGHCDHTSNAGLTSDDDCIRVHRASMMRWARDRFRWSRVAKIWADTFSDNQKPQTHY